MAFPPDMHVQATSAASRGGSSPPAKATGRIDLPLFRFGLRHLFVLVAAVSVLLAGLVSLPGITALAFLLASLVVTLHVFGTALGSQLRRHANQADAVLPPRWECNKPDVLGSMQDGPKPNPLPWYGRNGSSLAWLPRLIAAAALVGGCLGAMVLAVAFGHRTSLAGLLVGALSLAVVSGWFAFLGGSFIAIVRGGLSEAVADANRNESPSSAAK